MCCRCSPGSGPCCCSQRCHKNHQHLCLCTTCMHLAVQVYASRRQCARSSRISCIAPVISCSCKLSYPQSITALKPLSCWILAVHLYTKPQPTIHNPDDHSGDLKPCCLPGSGHCLEQEQKNRPSDYQSQVKAWCVL